jgi:hypothetical protein
VTVLMADGLLVTEALIVAVDPKGTFAGAV